MPSRILAITCALLLSIIGLTDLAAGPATATDSTTPQALLNLLRIGSPSTVAYDRDRFAEGLDVDVDGCNTRREVLQLESLVPVTIPSGCDITAGEWFSWYEGTTHTDPSAVEMDHLVSLKETWISGAWAWTDQQRADYANDLDSDETLTIVTGAVNGAKGASDPAMWVPSLEASRCEYASDWIVVKYRWNLTVDAAEYAALDTLIDSYCGDRLVEIPPVRTDTASSTPMGGVNAVPAGTHRLAGSNRFGTAVAIAAFYNPGVAKVYIANGLNYPDALAASAVAAHEAVPLLTVLPTSIPANVWAELQRLAPQRIVIAGGPSNVSAAVEQQLASLAPVVRYAGANRYETSRLLVEQAGLTGTRPFIATGNNYPDALSAAAAAGTHGTGVILVNGAASSVDDATRQTLEHIGATGLQIAGGTPSVSAGIASSLSELSPTRYGGSNRYQTGALINDANFSYPSTVFLAFGLNFPDALSGGALAGALDAPLFIVEGNCIPSSVYDLIERWNPTTRVVLGSEASLSSNVANLVECAPPPTTPPPPTPPGNPGNSKNCSDFSTWAQAQQWFEYYFPYYGDVAQLDADNDHIACESLP